MAHRTRTGSSKRDTSNDTCKFFVHQLLLITVDFLFMVEKLQQTYMFLWNGLCVIETSFRAGAGGRARKGGKDMAGKGKEGGGQRERGKWREQKKIAGGAQGTRGWKIGETKKMAERTLKMGTVKECKEEKKGE